MRLKKVTLRNFRCFENLELELHPRLTVLVGNNGAGKTAIMDGIAIALSPILRYLSSANCRLTAPDFADTDFRLEYWGVRAGLERWGASETTQVCAETTDGLCWDHWKASLTDHHPADAVGDAALTQELSRLVDTYRSNTADQHAIWPVLAYYGSQRGYIKVPQRLRATQQSYDYPAAALLNALDAHSDFREMLQWFDNEEAAWLRENAGRDPARYTTSPALEAVRAAVTSLLGGKYSNPRFNREHKFVLDDESGCPLQVSQLSQGYQSMLALAMDFARRQALACAGSVLGEPVAGRKLPPALIALLAELGLSEEDEALAELYGRPAACMPGIMLIDEVDLHLHPAWQQRVLTDLLQAFPATQFIVTTHSPQVLSTVHRDNIRVITTDAAGQLVATRPLAMTYGEPSGDVMHSVMQVDPQPPVPEKDDLQRLTELVDQGLYDEPEAQQLQQKLIAQLEGGEAHPQLQRLQRSIRRQQLLRGRPA